MREGHQKVAENIWWGRSERKNTRTSKVPLVVVGTAGIQVLGNVLELGEPRKTSCTATTEKAGKGGWIGSRLKESFSQHPGGAQ